MPHPDIPVEMSGINLDSEKMVPGTAVAGKKQQMQNEKHWMHKKLIVRRSQEWILRLQE